MIRYLLVFYRAFQDREDRKEKEARVDHRCVTTDMAAENCFEACQRMYCRGSVITCLFSEFLSYIKVDDQRVSMGVVKSLVVAFISKLHWN